MAKPVSVIPRQALLLVLLALLLVTPAIAQGQPSIGLDATRYAAGDTVNLKADDLEPEAAYSLEIDGPGEADATEELSANGDGTLEHSFRVELPGEWMLRLSGEDLNATMVFEVVEQGAGRQPATQEEDPAPNGEPGTPADERQSDPTEEGPADPERTGEAARDEAAERGTEAENGAQPGRAAEPEGNPSDAGEAPATPAGPDAAPEDRPAESTAEEPRPPLEISVDGDAIVARRGAAGAWRFDFPEGSGGTGAVLEGENTLWVGHGNSVLIIDRETGQATSRFAMPGRVIRLEPSGTGVSVVSDVDGNLRQRIEVDEQGPASTVRFGIDPEQFGWLRAEAEVSDPEERLAMDPTNPWLHLRVGLEERDVSERQERLSAAVESAETFYDLAGIARDLAAAGEYGLAEAAMDRALQDFAARGYDPRLLVDEELHRAYGFPLVPMDEALEAGDLAAAEFWAPWLYLLAADESPATGAALERYARRLAAAGRSDAAALWRERAAAGSSASPAASLDRFFLALGRAGWYGVAAVLVAILALHLTLVAKYWAPQSLAMRRARETGGARRPLGRLFAIRYYSFTEKLVLVLLFAAALSLLGLARWYDASGERPRPLASGTLASPAARDVVTSSPLQGPRGAFIRGYAAQTAGEDRTAREEYLAAGDYPPALNNLAALLDDDVLYRRALELAPGLPEAAFNLGRAADPSPFHAAYRSGEPLLAVPGSSDFRTAISGSWQDAIASTFENPWRALREAAPRDMHPLAWQAILALLLVWVLVTVIWLFIPRPALARNAPRSFAYHVLALLIPGSGLADEAWGLLLMVPWSLLGVDALAQWLGWPRSLGIPLETELWGLAAIYIVNLVAFVIEFLSYRRRMRNLRRSHPEAFEAYGMRGT